MKQLEPDRLQLLAATTFSPDSGIGSDRSSASVNDVEPPATGRSPETSLSRAAFVIADGHGSCLDATAAALEMLGIDIETLRLLRVGDLTKANSPDSLTRQLVASCDQVGSWLTGTCELLRADGATVPVRFGTLRLKSGELVARFERLPRPASRAAGPREILEAWRQQELALARTPQGTIERQVVELEALWLAAEYQRLAIERTEATEGAP
jgi:hypothetical protein